jgi:spore germination protein YaaH
MYRALLNWLACLLLVGSLQALQQPRLLAKANGKPSPALTATRKNVLRARPLRMLYYSDDAFGLESLEAHAREMTLLAPQCFWVDADGFVHGALPSEVRDIAERAHLSIMPLVVNRGFDRNTASALLRSIRAQERAATYLAYLAKRDHFIGFQIDLENIDPADKKLFSRFVGRVAARLHRDGRLVSAAVVPRFSDTYPGRSRSGEFSTGQWGAPYDYPRLGRVVDFLSLMTYDHHGRESTPGPIAGQAWVEEALQYAVRHIPPRKILLGIPFYGRDWIESERGTTAKSLTFQDAMALLKQAASQEQWDERWGSPWFQYREGSALHTVWFEDSRSLGEKLRLIERFRLRGFAAWRLGAEDPQFWELANVKMKPRGAHHMAGAVPSRKRPASPRAAMTPQ